MTVHLIIDDAPLPSATGSRDDFRIRVSAMLERERHYLCRDYLGLMGSNKTKPSPSIGAVNAASRAKICRWIFHTVERSEFQKETAVEAISLLDRFASSDTSARAQRARSSLCEYQLVALTSLFVAIKTTEQIEIDAATMSLFMKEMYSTQAIISCEKVMFESLQWKLCGPSPLQFIRCILDLLPTSLAQEVQEKSQRQVELASEDYACIVLSRSSLAVAAVMNSLQAVSQGDCKERRAEVFRVLSNAFGLDVVESKMIKAIRMRLLRSSSLSSSHHMPQKPNSSLPRSA